RASRAELHGSDPMTASRGMDRRDDRQIRGVLHGLGIDRWRENLRAAGPLHRRQVRSEAARV
ncbi:MAG: hypothetical protein J0I66_00130, partial [Microbacterium sp.]|nr:hypothetical protein [Microbacterium sp.]